MNDSLEASQEANQEENREEMRDLSVSSEAERQFMFKATGYMVLLLAVLLSAFQVWQGVTSTVSATYFRPAHLAWIMVLVFLHFPMIKKTTSVFFSPGRIVDIVLSVITVVVGYRLVSFDYNDINHMLYGLQTVDLVSGVVYLGLIMEACRRTVGWVMVAIAMVFLSYSAFGDLLPAAFATKAYSLEELIRFQMFSSNGVFGSALGIASTTVFVFVLFGAFLEVSGAGKFFIDMAFAIAGKTRGGPAKAAVIASAGLGSISGSAIANTVTTGAITIPMMKKLGYKPEQAAGIEAAASTGGQIMPPIMGAGAFVMAQFTGIAYSDIMLASIAPALLYFLCTLVYVHLMASKLNLEPVQTSEAVWTVMKSGAHFLIPLILITALLVIGYSPLLVGIIGCFSIILVAAVRKHSRIGIRKIITGMKNGALLALPISVACGAAGVIVGVVGQTGIGLQFTQFVTELSGGYMFTAIVLISLVALVLGMGLPVTAAYIVLAVMAVPLLGDFGLPLLTSHLIVFWLSQTSNVTPPIALAAFAGAGVANANPMRSSIEAFKLAAGLFIIPLMMAYSGLIIIDDHWLDFVLAIVRTIAIIVAMAMVIEGYFLKPLTVAERFVALMTTPVLLFDPAHTGLAAVAVIGVLLYRQWSVREAGVSRVR